MYTEESTTGINLMDMSRRQAMMVRDALIHAAVSTNDSMDNEERIMITHMADSLKSVCDSQSNTNLKNLLPME